ncbi:MAG: glycosyltransferase family 4 protein, partial [Planctomycetes bacterium]|nr:glycosyltransferase family 4 protein [Planctomycetota bacterium]
MGEPRRILFLNHVPQVSGAENSLLALMGVLDRAEFEPVLACPDDGELPDRARAMGIDVRPAPMRRIYRTANPLRLAECGCHVMSVAAWIGRLAKAERIALIHANSTTAQLYGAAAARLTGVPSVWHVRDLTPLGRIGKMLYRLSDRVIAISWAVARRIAPAGRQDPKTAVVHNGIDADEFRKDVTLGRMRHELGWSKEQNVVSMIGQIVPWKGHVTFIESIAKLPDVMGLIVGDDLFGNHSSLVRTLHDLRDVLGIENRVRFLGWRSDVKDIIADSDVIAVPSSAEPLGRVALEAMALGRPVVGTNAGGLPEVVADGETGRLVPPGDARALAEALREVL